jgi:ABC-type iron transport system FetAB ATPase subunit
MNVRFGTMIVGPTGAGKSECYHVLAEALISMKQSGTENPLY